jgi:hypothetical protein
MPRQPYLKVVPNPRGAIIEVSTKAIGERPELETLIGNCLMAWPHVEAEMALLLGQLLGTENAAAIAVFQALRQSRAQRDLIGEAAKVSLSDSDQELVSAILNLHKSVEAERNALTHGHFGTSTKISDGIIWMTSADYVAIRSNITLVSVPTWNDAKHLKLLSAISVYKAADLTTIFEDMIEVANSWYNLVIYFRSPIHGQIRADRYRQLCDRPHIARELAKLRREKTPPTQTE